MLHCRSWYGCRSSTPNRDPLQGPWCLIPRTIRARHERVLCVRYSRSSRASPRSYPIQPSRRFGHVGDHIQRRLRSCRSVGSQARRHDCWEALLPVWCPQLRTASLIRGTYHAYSLARVRLPLTNVCSPYRDLSASTVPSTLSTNTSRRDSATVFIRKASTLSSTTKLEKNSRNKISRLLFKSFVFLRPKFYLTTNNFFDLRLALLKRTRRIVII